jgi:hypothetical protein
MRSKLVLGAAFLAASSGAAWAGPPYFTDDPEPTDLHHFEIYAYNQGTVGRDGTATETGIDFNYGGLPGLQISAVLPLVRNETGATGIGNIELGGKYRFLTQEDFGLDVAAFPTLSLPNLSKNVGDDHASFFLPLWAQKDFGKWTIFGGGGCTLNRTRDTTSFCQEGVALLRQVTDELNLGVEVFHQGAEDKGGRQETALGVGAVYNLDEVHHLLVHWGPNMQNGGDNGRYSWYTAMLFTF